MNDSALLSTASGDNVIRALRDYRLEDSATGDNKILNAGMMLLGLAILLRKLNMVEDVGALLSQAKKEVAKFEQDLTALGYNNATVMAARYVICTVLDESVLSQDWGTESIWSTRPLLSTFHKETWGGEKFFSIRDRLKLEPEKFSDLLQFVYFTQALGFEGKYNLRFDGQEKLHEILRDSHALLKSVETGPIFQVAPAERASKIALEKRFPLWGVLGLTLLVLAFVFFGFRSALDSRLDGLFEKILQQTSLETGG